MLRRDVRAHIRVRDEAGDIDGHDLVPGLLCLLQKRCGRRENAGVVERDVEAAELIDGRLNQRLRVVRVGHVGLDEDGLAAGRGDFLDHLVGLLRHIADDHRRTAFRESLHRRRAGGDEDLGDTRKRTAPPVSGGTVPDCGA